MIEKVTVRMNDKRQMELAGDIRCQDLNPKAMMLLAAGKCAGLTAISIMQKERVTPKRLEITVSGDMSTDTVVAETIFRSFNVLYNVECSSEDDQSKVSRAIDLTHEKHCGMMQMLRKVAPVAHDVAIVSTQPAKV